MRPWQFPADLGRCVNGENVGKSTTIITTTNNNKSFAQWTEVFPNAACVVALINRLIHHAEIISLHGKPYRHNEASKRTAAKNAKRNTLGGKT